MKSILKYIRDYFRLELKYPYFLLVCLLLGIAIWTEYQFELSSRYVDAEGSNLRGFMMNYALYALPFFSTYLLYIIFYKRFDLLRNHQFILLLSFAVAIYAFRAWFSLHKDVVAQYTDSVNYYYWVRTANQWIFGILLLFPVLLYWYFTDRKNQIFYGLRHKGVNLKPYFTMLLIMIPLIGWAATQADFLRMYPVISNTPGFNADTPWYVFKLILFELSYGFDFAMNELFFRGFLILSFARFVGRGAILPMAAFYVFIHFGKPLGETISSFFGGLILGIIAYETRSIYGGIIAHLGVAYMMESFGAIGSIFFKAKP